MRWGLDGGGMGKRVRGEGLSGARLEGEVALVDAAPLDVEHEAPAGALVVDGEVQRLLQAAGAVVSGGDFSAEGTRQVLLRAVVDA